MASFREKMFWIICNILLTKHFSYNNETSLKCLENFGNVWKLFVFSCCA